MSFDFRWRAAFLVLLLMAAAAPGAAQQAGASTSRVVGRVIDQGSRRPIQGVSVLAEDNVTRAITDEQGRFFVDEMQPGDRQLTFDMIGYSPRTETVTLRPGVTQEIQVTLSQQAVRLDSIAVSVRSGWLESSGFYEREQVNPGGNFITREKLEQRQSRQLTDALREVPGIRTFYLDAGRIHVRFNREGSNDLLAFDPANERSLPGCEPDLYVDGILFRERAPSGNAPRVAGWDIVDVNLIEGIETYSGPNAPLQYQHPCGVILVWTRRGTAPGVVARTNPAPAPAAERGRMPALEAGTLVRLRPRIGNYVRGRVSLVDADSLVLAPGPRQTRYTVLELRSLDRDGGLASPVERVLRGGKWGFMVSVLGVAVAAAVEEFQALGHDEDSIAGSSPRKPAIAMRWIGAGTLSGAILGGAFWRYREWISIPLR